MMDWAQASPMEQIWVGLGIIVWLLLVLGTVAVVLYVVGHSAMDAYRRVRRKRKTTAVLKCEACEFNVEDGNLRRCERFGQSISCAPVRELGCSWGMEKKAVKR